MPFWSILSRPCPPEKVLVLRQCLGKSPAPLPLYTAHTMGLPSPSAQHKGHAQLSFLPSVPFASKATATKPQPGMQSLPRRKRLL